MIRHGVRLLTAVAVAALLGVAGCSGGTDKAGGTKPAHVVVLHMLNTRAAGDVQPFVDKVAELSGGALRLEGHEKWGLGSTTSEVEAIRAIQAGQADVAVVPARAWHEVGVTSFDALIAPLTVESMAVQEKALSGDLPARMLAGLHPVGLTGIGILPGPMRKPAGITRSLLEPSDYRGTTIGFNQSAVADRALRALGARPVASPFERADISMFDGIEQQAGSVAANQYDDTVHTITRNVNLWPRPLVVVGNAKAMQQLSDRQVGWLRSAARSAVASTTQAQMTDETREIATMCRRGRADFVTATPRQLAQLRSAFQPVYAWLRQDKQTSRFLDDVAALRASGIRPFPQESLTCAGVAPAGSATTSPVSTAPTPFDGTYRMVTTQQELRRRDPEAQPENWGNVIWVFGGGRFASTQENPAACTWNYGTYEVSGQRIEWTFTDGGGFAPTHATNQPGEHFVLRWSRYRDTMTLTTISPTDVVMDPWHRLSGRPSVGYLSKRCPPPAQALVW